MNGTASIRSRTGWNSAENLFSAGLFCLFLGMALGAKLIAAGQVLVVAGLVRALVDSRGNALAWGSMPGSAWCLVAFVVISSSSVLANLPVIAAPLEHLGKLRYLVVVLFVLAMPWLVRDHLRVPWRRDSLVLAWLLPLAFAILIGVIGWWTGRHPLRGDDLVDIRRVSGLYGQVMTFAYSLQFSVVILAAFVLYPGMWRRITRIPSWVAILGLLITGGALYLTYTRGAMLGAATGMVALATMRSWKIFVAVLAIGLAGGVVASLDGARYFDTKSDIRVGQWKAASLSFLERPLFGWGYRNFELHSAELKERYGFEKDLVRKRGKRPEVTYFQSHAHNNFLESFASTGFAGGLAFLAFCICWMREAWRSRYARFLIPPIAAFLVSGLFENTFFDSEVLNCVLILYLLTQWTRRFEDTEGGDAITPASPGPTSV